MHIVLFSSLCLQLTPSLSLCTYICEIINKLEYTVPQTNYHANKAATKRSGTANVGQIVGKIPQCTQEMSTVQLERGVTWDAV